MRDNAGTMGAMAVISRRPAIFSGINEKNRESRPNLPVHCVGQSSHDRLRGMTMCNGRYASGRLDTRALMTASESSQCMRLVWRITW